MNDLIETWSGRPTDVVLEVPAVPASLRVVRMVAATVAADAGFDIDEVDDVRMAVDELCAAVIESGPASPLRIHVRLADEQLVVRVQAAQPDPAGAAALDELRAAVLGATAGDYGFALADGHSIAWLAKRSGVAAAGRGLGEA